MLYRSDQTKTLQVVATSGAVRGSRLLKHPHYGQTQRLKGMGSTKDGPKRLPSRRSASSPAICYLSFRRFAASECSPVSRRCSENSFTALSAITALTALPLGKHHLADSFVWVAITHCDLVDRESLSIHRVVTQRDLSATSGGALRFFGIGK